MAPKYSFKVTKTKKTPSKESKVPNIVVEDVPSSYPSIADTSPRHVQLHTNIGFQEAPSGHRPITSINTNPRRSGFGATLGDEKGPYQNLTTRPILFYNGRDFTLEECQLICSLYWLDAEDDLVSEIIKHERQSSTPVNCAGINQYLLNPSLSQVKDRITHPLCADVGAARRKALDAYERWMDYMTGIVWRYQDSGRVQELIDMAPNPFRWVSLVPGRPGSTDLLFGEVDDIPYSWNEPGWDVGEPFDPGVT